MVHQYMDVRGITVKHKKYEIVVWVKGQVLSHRFENQSEETVARVMECVTIGKAFVINRDGHEFVMFGSGKVDNVQFTIKES